MRGVRLQPDAGGGSGGGSGSLSSWEKAGRSAPRSSAPRKKRRWGRIILITSGVVAVLLAIVVALAPTIASSMAPKRIEDAAAAQLQGKVKVGAVSVGWFSATSVGPVEIIDPDGKTAAKLTVKTPTTLWTIVSQRWWSMKNLDAGVVELSGALDLVRDEKTGKTNLQRALEPRAQAVSGKPNAKDTAPGAKSGAGIQTVKAVLKLNALDATVRDRGLDGKLSPELGVKGLAGETKIDYAASPMTLNVVSALAGTSVGGNGPADTIKLALDASVKPKQAGGSGLTAIDSVQVKLDVSNAPINLIDAIAGQGGALVQGIGPRAEIKLNAGGTPKNASVKLAMNAERARADLDLLLKDNVLSAQASAPASGGAGGGGGGGGEAGKSNTITLQSTEFLASVPQLREVLAKAGAQIKVSSAPGVQITIENLKWPVPAALVDGGDAKGALAKADFRAHGLDVRVQVGAMQGQIALPTGGGGGAPNATAPANWRAFGVAPMVLEIRAADLSQPVMISGGTKATIDGSPAGDITINARAEGLLTAAGNLRALTGAGLADTVNASVQVKGMSTALVQPIVAGADLAIDLNQDVGPTLDMMLDARADVRQGGGGGGGGGGQAADAMPPIEAKLNITSANIRADATGRLVDRVITTTGEGVVIQVQRGAPMAARMMSKPGEVAPIALSGNGGVRVTMSEVVAPLDKMKGAKALGALKAKARVEVSDLGVLPSAGGSDVASAAVAAAQQPVRIDRGVVNLTLDGASPPRVELSSQMAHEGQAFELTGQMTLDGIVGGKMPAPTDGAAKIIALKPTGRVDLKGLPRSVLNLLPATSGYGTTAIAGVDMPAQINRAIRESIGASATMSVVLQPKDDGLVITSEISTAAGGVRGGTSATLSAGGVKAETLELVAGMDPRVVNPVLASAGGGGGGGAPIQLAQRFAMTLKAKEPIVVPFKPGTMSPDFAKAGNAAIALTTDNDIGIDNVPTGADERGNPRTVGVRVRGFRAEVMAPLSGLDASLRESKRASMTFALAAFRAADSAPIADVSGSASGTMSGKEPEATVKLAGVECAVVDGLIGQPGMVSGALGERADVNLKITPQGGGTTRLTADIAAPRLTDAKFELVQEPTRMALSRATTMTWRPDPAFVNRYAFKGDQGSAGGPVVSPRGGGGGGGGIDNAVRDLVKTVTGEGQQSAPAAVGGAPMTITQIAPITITLSKLVLSSGVGEGPLKPGVFDVDASVNLPQVGITTQSRGGAPTVLGLESTQVSVRHQAGAGGAGGEIVANLGIARITGNAGAAEKRSTANVRIANFADAMGKPTPQAMVLNLDADLTSFPTPIIDQLANQKGILAELLGPTVNVQATGRNVTLGAGGGAANAAGTLEFKANSPRARAEVKGEIRQGTFVQTGPITAELLEIRPEFIRMLQGSLPIVDSVTKSPTDAPAISLGKDVSVPLDGDVSKINGVLTIDPGVARFTTNNFIGSLLKKVGGQSAAEFGRKLEPFTVRAVNGVLTYDQFTLPLGEFDLKTRGTVDLVRRQIDVITYVPLLGLSDIAAGSLNTGLAGRLGVLDQATPVPIVTRGSLDNPKTEIDLGLFVKERGDQLLKQPEKIINDVIGDLLKPKNPPKK